jgi:hypothetical protein
MTSLVQQGVLHCQPLIPKIEIGGKYKQEFCILQLFVHRALTYKVEGLMIYLNEKAINYHIVPGHTGSNDALIGSVSF